MGVDCGIHLPDRVRVSDVAKVIAASVGIEVVNAPITSGGKTFPVAWIKDRTATTIKPYNTAGLEACVEIQWTRGPKTLPGLGGHSCMYHLEPSHGGRLLMPPSTPQWLAIGHALIEFFGGTLDYQDCDTVDVDETVPDRWEDVDDEDAFDRFERRVLAVKPLTRLDIEAYRLRAKYP